MKVGNDLVRTAGLAAAVLVFASPPILAGFGAAAPSYPALTVILTSMLVALVVAWPWPAANVGSDVGRLRPFAAIVAAVAAIIVIIAMYRWTRRVVWERTQADMLIVIREATRRFLNGKNPYATYRTFDAPWEMVLPYGPALWGPFLIAQLLRLDFRLITIIGQLFVPVWCGVTAVAESARGRIASAVAWLGVLVSLVFAFQSSGFAMLGHTPVYWPLFPVLAVTVVRRQWTAAAAVLGWLVVARSTMAALVPVLAIAVWTDDRGRLPRTAGALAIPIVALLLPFIVWDYHAIWDGMVLSYPRVIKSAVWASARPGAIHTIGLTGVLLDRHLDSFVEIAQVVVMIGTYAVAWRQIARGAHPLGWMTLALLAFSMTTLYPVDYLYYDVLLLLISGTLIETLETGAWRMNSRPFAITVAGLVLLMAITVYSVADSFPDVAAGEPISERPFRSGFERPERDGPRQFSWMVGSDATIVMPRSSAAAADIVLTAQSPFDANHPPQMVTAVLNGQLLGHAPAQAGWQDIHFNAPASAWWVGYNELRLAFAGTLSPREAGTGNDPRRLALALSRVHVRSK